MKDYYSFFVQFQGIDFDAYWVKSECVAETHRAELLIQYNEIELKLFYDERTHFGEKLSQCIFYKGIDEKIGSHIKISHLTNKPRLQKIDFSDATCISIINDTKYYESGEKYVVVKLNSVKLYWEPEEESINTAEFYLEDTGFRMVEPFYSVFSGYDGCFDFPRMQGRDVFYTLGKSEFRPEFNTYSKDSRANKVATITKEPKLQFKYKESVSEEEAILYGDLICLLASFYHHVKINYFFYRIRLPEYVVEKKKIVEDKWIPNIQNIFFRMNVKSDFHEILQLDIQNTILKSEYFKTISKAINLFNQAHLVDSHSEFLIRYNIIEIFNNEKEVKKEFNFILGKSDRKKKYKEAKEILLQTIDKKEDRLFSDIWNSLLGTLKYKPMRNSLDSFLEKQNIPVSILPFSIKALCKTRNDIVHGSINNVEPQKLKEMNRSLYRINMCLILNAIGVKEWKPSLFS